MNACHLSRPQQRSLSPYADDKIQRSMFPEAVVHHHFQAGVHVHVRAHVRMGVCACLSLCIGAFACIDAQAHAGSEARGNTAPVVLAHVPAWLVDAHEAAARQRAAAHDDVRDHTNGAARHHDAAPAQRLQPAAAFISRHRAPSATMPRRENAASGASPAVSVSPAAAPPTAPPTAPPSTRAEAAAQDAHVDRFFEYHFLNNNL